MEQYLSVDGKWSRQYMFNELGALWAAIIARLNIVKLTEFLERAMTVLSAKGRAEWVKLIKV